MKSYKYHMPVKLYIGENIITENSALFNGFGKKALIVTGRNSSYKNGSMADCVKALESNKTDYKIFDETEENPSLETVSKAAKIGKDEGCDFCIGIGGGSPLDVAKAVGILIKNPDASVKDLFDSHALDSVPLIAIPTTAGTGSETTQYSILTIHEKKTKQSIPQSVFFDIAFLDARYTLDMPRDITVSTAVDALTHLIESYLCQRADSFSDRICETGFSMFRELKKSLLCFDLDFEKRERLLIMSSIGGMCIAQTGTSLPHGMGYALTYFKQIPHGAANGLVTAKYLELCDKDKTANMLNIMGYNSIAEFGAFLSELLDIRLTLTEDEITEYSSAFTANKNKLKAHPFPVSYEDVVNIYKGANENI